MLEGIVKITKLHVLSFMLSYILTKYCRCVDYLMVDRSPFGTSESCGNETQADASPDQLELG